VLESKKNIENRAFGEKVNDFGEHTAFGENVRILAQR